MITKEQINTLIDLADEPDLKSLSTSKIYQQNKKGKFHLKITLKSIDLKQMSKIESTKKIYKTLDKELKESIHSIQILIT